MTTPTASDRLQHARTRGATRPARCPPRADHVRFVFLDALRGFALVFMVLNHTGRWWQDGIMGWPRYYMIYVTMAVAAPIFLFLVGFCLPLSKAREEPRALPMLWKYAKRGARLILAGLLLNLLVFPEDPIYSNGVLQTIGVSIVAAAAGALLLRRPGMRPVLAALAVLLYLAFGWSFGALDRLGTGAPHGGPDPVLRVPAMAVGEPGARRSRPRRPVGRSARRPGESPLHVADGGRRRAVLRCVSSATTGGPGPPIAGPSSATTSSTTTGHPAAPRAIWVLGMIFVLMPAFYYLAEVRRWRMTWLVTLGRTALVLYFIHQLIVLTLVNQRLGLRMNDWPWYLGANLALSDRSCWGSASSG